MAWVKHLRIYRFRNIAETEIELEGNVAVFHGENAQGKTNVLEAVHILSNLQSFRTRRMSELITRGEKISSLKAEVMERGHATSLGVILEGDGKTAEVNGKTPRSAVEYLEVLRTVFFGPQDVELAGGNLAMRRRYLDRAVFSQDPLHLERMRNHSRALRQRNEALRSGVANVEPWSEQLAVLWHEISLSRLCALEGLKSRVAEIHRDVSGGREEIVLSMRSTEKAVAGGVEGLLRVLAEDEDEDRKRGYTRHGPHRDRIEVSLDGREISTHASQGQRRTAAVSMKLAMLGWVEEKAETLPVFILDDPGSELDRNRLGYLGEFIGNFAGQTLISSVGPDDVPVRGRAAREYFAVCGGKVEKNKMTCAT